MTQTLEAQFQGMPQTGSPNLDQPQKFHEFSEFVKQQLFPMLVNLQAIGLVMGIDAEDVRFLVADRVVRFYEGDEGSPMVTDQASVFMAMDKFYEEDGNEPATQISAKQPIAIIDEPF